MYLKIKRALLRIPPFVPKDTVSLIELLLTKNGNKEFKVIISYTESIYLSIITIYLSMYLGNERLQLALGSTITSQQQQDKQQQNNDQVDKKGQNKPFVFSYDSLRSHSYFRSCSTPPLTNIAGFNEVHNTSACKVTSLKDLSIRAVGCAAVQLAEAMYLSIYLSIKNIINSINISIYQSINISIYRSLNGGVRPDTSWMKKFNLLSLDSSDRYHLSI
jgi:hypothetical protein